VEIFGHRIPMHVSLAAWCIVWEFVGRADLVFLIPPITDILQAGYSMVQTGTWQRATVETVRAFAIGMGISVAAGVPLGILMGRLRDVDDLLGLWVNMLASAPLTALVPVLMIFFGIGETTVIATVFLFAVWIIVLDTRAGIMGVPSSLEEMAVSYGASKSALYSKVLFSAALPEILAGIRLGIVRGVKGVVVGQILVAIVGYGAMFEIFSRAFDMAHFWALAFILFAAALCVASLIEALERRVEYYASVR
jgi:NitT/TauT family transport system permease protein